MSVSSSSAVDGLISGLDTTSIITKLLQVDAAPQTALKGDLTDAQKKVAAYQSVNSKLAAVQAAADALQTATTWASTKASASDTSMTVTATGTAVPATLQVEVDALASGRSVVTAAGTPITVAADGTITNPSSVPLPLSIVRSDGSYVTINPSVGTLSDMVSAINKASSMGLSAVAIRTGDNQYRLQITSTTTGLAAGDFKLVNGTAPGATSSGGKADQGAAGAWNFSSTSYASLSEPAGLSTPTAAANASIQVGPAGATSIVTSASNTFANIMPGVSLTVSQLSPDSTGATAGPATGARKPALVTVASDPNAVATAIQSLVDSANAALKEISSQSAAGTISATGAVSGAGTLRGDSTLRTLKSQIVSAVTTAIGASNTSAASLGVQSTSTGSLTFDKGKFLTAYATNPVQVQGLVSGAATGTPSAPDGLVERLRKVTVYAVGDVKLGGTTATGVLTSAISGQNSSIKDLTNRISDWDVRLASKKAYYQKYYANLETALQKSKSQASWLSGQLSSLSGSSSE